VYSVLPSYSLGFHGCDAAIAERVFAGTAHLSRSTNVYDWLGEGIYFWENSPSRALEYATAMAGRPRPGGPIIETPAVVGAVIELGYCFNLLDAEFIAALRDSYGAMKAAHDSAGITLPVNKWIDGDLLLRPLDCAVINWTHTERENLGFRPFDTVRAAFAEGGEAYPGSGVTAKHHIQLCVRRRSCIKGYFRVLDEAKLPKD
jgi:hypothetical protein